MLGGVTLLGGFPGLTCTVSLSAGVAFCIVNVSRWGIPPLRGAVHVTFASAPNSNKNNMAVLAYKSGELYCRLHLRNVEQSEGNQAYSGSGSEEDPMESHASTVNNATLSSRPSHKQRKAREKPLRTKDIQNP